MTQDLLKVQAQTTQPMTNHIQLQMVNEIITEYNGFIEEWKELTQPVFDAREDAYEKCSIHRDKAATVREVVVGVMISYLTR